MKKGKNPGKKPGQKIDTIDLNLPANSEYLVIGRTLTSLVCRRMWFSEEVEEDIKIASSEAYINVIQHAYRNNHQYPKRISIRYLLYLNKIAIVVKDYGRGFDPYFVQTYIKRSDAQQPERVGLGIFLIRSLMDEVEYDSSLQTGTQVRMVKYK